MGVGHRTTTLCETQMKVLMENSVICGGCHCPWKSLTYISDALEHDGLSASVLVQKACKHLPSDTHAIRLWSDGGPHFRAYQFAYWSLIKLPRRLPKDWKHPVTVSLNFLAEMRGKGPCDGHLRRSGDGCYHIVQQAGWSILCLLPSKLSTEAPLRQ